MTQNQGSNKTIILVATIGALATIIVGFWQFVFPLIFKTTNTVSEVPSHKIDYTGRIIDYNTGNAISGAKVFLYLKGVPIIHYTDINGTYIFSVDIAGSSLDGRRVKVEADGYQNYESHINLSLNSTTFEDIRLKPNSVTNSLPHSVQKKTSNLAYCSAASSKFTRMAWLRWGTTTIEEACDLVEGKFTFSGVPIERSTRGFYNPNGVNKVKLHCANDYIQYFEGFGEKAFKKALDKRPNNTCTYEVLE